MLSNTHRQYLASKILPPIHTVRAVYTFEKQHGILTKLANIIMIKNGFLVYGLSYIYIKFTLK